MFHSVVALTLTSSEATYWFFNFRDAQVFKRCWHHKLKVIPIHEQTYETAPKCQIR